MNDIAYDTVVRQSRRARREQIIQNDSRLMPDKGPSLIHSADVTGHMALHRLVTMGVLTRLDDTCGYRNDYADTLVGRALIVESMIPYGATAAGKLALWVWVGGRFPTCVDLISTSHYRARVHGRDVHVHNRRMLTNHVVRLAGLRITSPIRTACDLACMAPVERQGCDVNQLLAALMVKYAISPDDCLDMLWCNQRWPRHSLGITTFIALKRRRKSWEDSDGDRDGRGAQIAADRDGVTAEAGAGAGVDGTVSTMVEAAGRSHGPGATKPVPAAHPSRVGPGMAVAQDVRKNVRPKGGRPVARHGFARPIDAFTHCVGSA
ncbi:hypothetical protein JS532_04870 [Bifidobacterium callimiconis]|uniref:hypothetical protein n=1 Tax=Bifidobacterium callimiconis TaxID=2306973 RepID=UPI001BDC9D9D|nr:hypothetical protein [Bifidobacterium callimiconis]MBT1176902.1 hypothetical protein [Bifidobacterium callimiconis]